ncbi:Glycine cleavage system transcriptional activator [Paraburkholderia unamae]|uniref:LysR substrate-binding domain-containing protein n=1 Tax=Paraburkholderia unamae TaxID=219649 RepID=UPI001CAC834E|nr:LysR substrate-binding domain-containing protein [Paraburkholderia unamae]CAG9246137.1 Glycine cleavage system transcriptional activator [Paraburkholderia unamae]
MTRYLPPLNALRVFEVAARAGSYTAAARELNLTHGAVSRHIAILEEWLGQPLFVRDGQRMVASAHALALAREISSAFDHIADASERYGKGHQIKVIRVSTPATVAMRWLVPRLAEFTQRWPDVDVRVSTTLSTEPTLRGSFDLAIRRDAPVDGQYQVQPLFTEWNTVIAKTSLLGGSGEQGVEALASQTWLSTETRPREWENWLEAAGAPSLRPARSLRFDHFFVTLRAVMDGLGCGIGPFPTIASDIGARSLCCPFADIRSKGSTYYALVPIDADKPAHLMRFIDWMLEKSKEA